MLKSTISEKKNLLEGLNSRFELAEIRIMKLKGRLIETMHYKQKNKEEK